MKNKLALVGLNKTSHWKSCNYISEELQKRLSALYPGAAVFFQEQMPTTLESFSTFIFFDHRWISDEVLEVLKNKKDLSVCLYIYGDFSIRVKELEKIITTLKDALFTFVVASKAQQKMVAKIFPELEALIQVRPYPIPSSFLTTAPRLPSSEKVRIGYLGRLSEQKGVLSLLRVFRKLAFLHPNRYSLRLCGTYDYLDFFQLNGNRETLICQNFIEEYLKDWPQDIEAPIFEVIERDPEKIKDFFSEIDLFVSPSTFHDEDFGLSVAEALSQAIPSLLTKWGGYNDFLRQFPELTSGIDVTFSQRGYVVDENSLLKGLLHFEKGITAPQSFEFAPPQLEKKGIVKLTEHPLRSKIIEQEAFLRDKQGKLNKDLYLELYNDTYME